MKKLIVVLMVSIFLLSGCGEDKLETMNCTYKTTNNGLSSKTTYAIDYNGNVVDKMRITYDYINNDTADDDDNTTSQTSDIDGVGTGTDGVTDDNSDDDNNEIIDGMLGNTIDDIINAVTDTVLDILEYRNRHISIQNMYGGINGFSVQNTSDSDDNHYMVTYIIDFNQISDDDLNTLNLSRDINTLRSNYINQGFTCY